MAVPYESEIKRKAEAGIAMDTPTPEKQAVYDQHQQYIKNEITRKAMTGEQLSAPNQWKSQLYTQAQQQFSPQGQDSQIDALNRWLQESAKGQLDSQKAQLGQARDAQIAELEKAYADAIADGQISVREAEAQFQAQKAEIDKNSYQQAQQTQLFGQNMGIQNSQQMLGHMSADNQARNSMINENMTTRDRRVADITDRINAIKTKKNLDITNANATYNYGVADAQGQIDARTAEAQFGMRFDFAKMDKQNQQVLGQMAYQHGLNLETMNREQILALARMAKEQGYRIDLSKLESSLRREEATHGAELQKGLIDHQGNWDLKKMAQQFGYDSSLQRAQIAAANSRAKAQAKESDDGYDAALRRKLAEHGLTKEEVLSSGQFPEQRLWIEENERAKQSARNEIHMKNMYEADAQLAQELPKSPPKTPQANWFETGWDTFYKAIGSDRISSGSQQKIDQYNKDMAGYDQYKRWLETGSMN